MATTLNKISEQVWRIIKGGTPSDDSELTLREVRELVTQIINKRLKAEHISVHGNFGEHFPPHHLIATYDGIPVTSSVTPTTEIECTQMEDLVVTSVEMTIEHVGDDPDYYLITITGVNFSGVISDDILSLVSEASESCTLTFGTQDTAPVSFLIAGIEDFTIDGSTISFFYYPDSVPETGYWTTGDGLYWATGDGLFWDTGLGGPSAAIPQVLSDYVNDSHFYLESVLVGTSFDIPFNFTSLFICCIVSNEATINAVATLPAQPISLPRGMGIWRVYRPNFPNDQFIPLSSQVMGIAANVTHTNLSGVLGALTAYEYIDNVSIRFNQPASVIGSTVGMQLLVVDYTANPDALLPVPADMEEEVIRAAIDVLRVQPPLDNNNDENDRR
jgi:hypothetical protein